jgi:hypothetical protein
MADSGTCKYIWILFVKVDQKAAKLKKKTRQTMYKVVQIWPGKTVTCLHTNRPGHIWTTLYYKVTMRRVYETIVAVKKQ